MECKENGPEWNRTGNRLALKNGIIDWKNKRETAQRKKRGATDVVNHRQFQLTFCSRGGGRTCYQKLNTFKTKWPLNRCQFKCHFHCRVNFRAVSEQIRLTFQSSLQVESNQFSYKSTSSFGATSEQFQSSYGSLFRATYRLNWIGSPWD